MNWKSIFPNTLTALNLVFGILAIILALKGHLSIAPWCIALSAVADFLDGFVARLLKVSGPMGKQLDSLADVVTFGVAPGVMIMCLFLIFPYYSMLSSFGIDMAVSYGWDQWMAYWFADEEAQVVFKPLTTTQAILPLLGLLVPIFSALRLAKFNIDERQSDRFFGLPTPANALFLCSLVLIGVDAYGINGAEWKIKVFEVLITPMNLSILTVLFSLLLVFDLPLLALKFKSFSIKENWERYSLILTSILLLSVIGVWGIPIIVFLYLILSFLSELIRNKKHEVQS